jgi:hypothetical protein
MKSPDLVLYETKQKIINALNETNMPITVLSMLLNEIQTEVNNQRASTIQELIKSSQTITEDTTIENNDKEEA